MGIFVKIVISPCIFGKASVASVLWQFCSGSSERFKETQPVSNDLPWLKSLYSIQKTFS